MIRVLSWGLAAALLAAVPAAAGVEAARISAHARVLSSDAFEGRGPATAGEVKATAYIAEQFAALGLEPGGDHGGWFQEVALLRSEVKPRALSIRSGAETRPLAYGRDIVADVLLPVARVTLADAPMVFVGYGVRAPERGWDDYAGVDMRGKIAVVLVNDPDFEADLGGLFGGPAMTYYGRWTYKFEEAARQGAAGVLVIHEDRPAAYGWSTVENSWAAPQFDIVRDDPRAARTSLEGWITRGLAEDLFRRSGLDFARMKAKAQHRGFRATPLAATFSADLDVDSRQVMTRNVIARLPGAARPTETVLYTAHWDHLGRGKPDARGDDIYNGATDNALGVGGLLELARVFAEGPRPARSVAFVAFTAEETNSLGAEFYAAHPAYPLETTAIGFNLDGVSTAGRAADLRVVGTGLSGLTPDLAAAAGAQGRRIEGDPMPEAGLYYRSDQFPLAKRGLPVLYAGFGRDLRVGGPAAGLAHVEDFLANRYHQPSDEWSADWDLSGAVEDVEVIEAIGRRIADSDRWPDWDKAAEFEALRARSRAARK